MFKQITNDELNFIHLPPAESPWWIIEEFALSFDGYHYHGSFDVCADIANAAIEKYKAQGSLPSTIIDCITCPFLNNDGTAILEGLL